MKRVRLYPIYMFILATMLAACGEDRTYEYLEKTEENQWIFSQMKSSYLWGDTLKQPDRSKFFANSSDFFYGLLAAGDNTSFFTDSAAQTSYGMSFAIMRDPLAINPRNNYALVLFVEPGSPAARAGVKRGTWISRVGKTNISSSNYGYLERGESTTLCTWDIEMNDESMEYEWIARDTLTMEHAEAVTPTTLYMDTIYTLRNHKIGYIVYNRFEGTGDEVQQIASRFAGEEITELIIDLRYNSGGSLQEAVEVASCFVPQSAAGSTFCSLAHNAANSEKDVTYTLKSSSVHVEPAMVFILTTEATRGAAEAFTLALQSVLGEERVITVGGTTAGDNLYTERIESPYNFTMNPAVAQLYGPTGNILSPYGIYASYAVDELAQLYKLYRIGEEQEYLLYNTMYLIVNGTLPDMGTQDAAGTVPHKHLLHHGRSIIR